MGRQSERPTDAKFWDRHPELRIDDGILEEGILQATNVRIRAVAPEREKVGVTVLCRRGGCYSGCNVEGRFRDKVTAEQAALAAAVSSGEHQKDPKFVRAIVIAAEDLWPIPELVQEYCDDCLIVLVDPDLNIRLISSLSEECARSISTD